MEEYTRYCTHEQAFKALIIGAPIDVAGIAGETKVTGHRFEKDGKVYKLPTQEQMQRWIRNKFDINCFVDYDMDFGYFAYVYDNFPDRVHIRTRQSKFVSYEDAFSAAIEAALNYIFVYKNTKK